MVSTLKQMPTAGSLCYLWWVIMRSLIAQLLLAFLTGCHPVLISSAARLWTQHNSTSVFLVRCDGYFWLLAWASIGIFPERDRGSGHGKRGVRTYNGDLVVEPPAECVQGQSPWSGGQEAKPPWRRKLWSICTPKEGPKICCQYAKTV